MYCNSGKIHRFIQVPSTDSTIVCDLSVLESEAAAREVLSYDEKLRTSYTCV